MPHARVKFCDLLGAEQTWLNDGDMLKFHCGPAQHFAIYMGQVEGTGKHCIAHLLNNEGVCIDKLSDLPDALDIKCLPNFGQNDTVHIYRPSLNAGKIVKERALAQVGPHKYNVLTNNCEKWARGVFNNNSGTSYQAVQAVVSANALLVCVAASMVISPVAIPVVVAATCGVFVSHMCTAISFIH
uniref:LRAT domain-containing protein n=1 Tax=Ditylenchus dipsaci TaxID=166011 RepID=A0A915D1P8_9BILA